MNRIFEPRRELGRTGHIATQLGIGDVADRAVPLDQCVATVRRAMDAGLNVVDTAPGYEAGYSEEIVGRAVREQRVAAPGQRLFVVDKIDFLDQPVAPQVESSLKRMGLDAVDLFVFHALSDAAVWRKTAGPGGGMEQLAACVKRGLAKFRGISSHHPDVLVEAIESGLCDVVLFPVGPFVDARYVERVLPLAKAKGVGTICFKTFGAGRLVGDTLGYNAPLKERPRRKISSGGSDGNEAVLPRLGIEECVHYTLTHDPDVALLGMSFPNEQDAAFAAAKSFRPRTPAELAETRARAAVAIEGKGGSHWDPKKG
ncbi:MAG: aldo/keto reductase [Planctomycetota bacterium]|nr:aldo/keto reductase [Planctomycetota bacterium]